MSYSKNILERGLLAYSLGLPYHRGKWRVVDRVLRAGGLAPYGAPPQVKDVSRQGVMWRLNTGCLVQRSLYYMGVYEVNETRWLRSAIRPDWTVFDVGANFGYYSLLCARYSGEFARIFSFEPNPASMELLEANRTLNEYTCMETHACALSDKDGEMDLAVPVSGNEGLGQLVPAGQAGSSAGRVVRVRTCRVDTFVREHGIERLDFMKIDVEGAEGLVLEGARESLARFRPRMMVEINPEALAVFGKTAADLLGAIHAHGYRTYRVGRGHHLIPLRSAGEIGDYINAICLPA